MDEVEPPSSKKNYSSRAFSMFLLTYINNLKRKASSKEIGELAAIIMREEQNQEQRGPLGINALRSRLSPIELQTYKSAYNKKQSLVEESSKYF
ncbi:hypothetical protein CMI38_05295 [Candidatus Pacearchaeota archaeon]|jgi:hypothetical protein|nr:hypothetical protein [Candidatus Pacearchaeota archaeon]|tara:strand:- start:44 stop:325 length:282 start_codon:yes stop_codon:yes gene_type:complete